MDYAVDGVDGLEWDFDISEALRWCWRHNASLEFEFLPEEGDTAPVIVLATPLRHPEGEVDRATAQCSTQGRVDNTIVELVEKARERLNLE